MARDLTEKQHRFIEAYLENGQNATRAAQTAGYQGSRATLAVVGAQNLTKHKVQDALALRQAALRNGIVGKTQEKLRLLWAIVQQATQIMDVFDHKSGKLLYRRMIDPKTAIGAIAEMNKMSGDYTSKRTEPNQAISFENTLLLLEQRSRQ